MITGGYQDIIEILVEEGANPRLKNDHGQTPLEVAVNAQIRKILEDYDPGTKCWKWEVDYNSLQIDKKPIGEVVLKSNENLFSGKFLYLLSWKTPWNSGSCKAAKNS